MNIGQQRSCKARMLFFVICSHMRVREKMKQQIKSIKLAKDLKQAGTSFVGDINRSREREGKNLHLQ